jgi:hypothetical protein
MRTRIAEVVLAPLFILGLLASPPTATAQKIVDLGVDTIRISKIPRGDDVEVRVSSARDTVARVIIRGSDRRDRDSDAAIVRTGENITVTEEQIVEGDVVAIGGSVTVSGEVRGDVVAIGGNVTLREGASISGDAVAIGGRIRRDAGSHLGGQDIGMNFIPSSFLRTPHENSDSSFFKFGALISFGLFLLLLGWLTSVLAEKRMQICGAFFVEHPWKSLLTGLAVVLLSPAAFVLLCVTIVGIPVALLMILLGPLAHAIGFLLVASVAGRRLLHRGAQGASWGWMRSLASGLGLFLGIILFGAIFRMLGNVFAAFGWVLTIFGWTVVFLASTVGLGSLILSRLGTEIRPQPIIPPPPPGPQFSTPAAL